VDRPAFGQVADIDGRPESRGRNGPTDSPGGSGSATPPALLPLRTISAEVSLQAARFASGLGLKR
jgi:hypothetical protein